MKVGVNVGGIHWVGVGSRVSVGPNGNVGVGITTGVSPRGVRVGNSAAGVGNSPAGRAMASSTPPST